MVQNLWIILWARRAVCEKEGWMLNRRASSGGLRQAWSFGIFPFWYYKITYHSIDLAFFLFVLSSRALHISHLGLALLFSLYLSLLLEPKFLTNLPDELRFVGDDIEIDLWVFKRLWFFDEHPIINVIIYKSYLLYLLFHHVFVIDVSRLFLEGQAFSVSEH